MFIIDLHYIVPMEQVDEVLAPHVAFLDQHLATGEFIAAGRKVPRTGGTILVNVADRARAEEIAAQDPFVTNNVATATVLELEVSRARPEFTALLSSVEVG